MNGRDAILSMIFARLAAKAPQFPLFIPPAKPNVGAMRRGLRLSCLLAALAAPTALWAHSSDQAFVLLLPTELYAAGGVAVVVLTMLVLAALPRLVAPLADVAKAQGQGSALASGLSAAGLALVVGIGLFGPPGPLQNLLPLVVWTLWWICLPALQPLVDIWRWINPWLWSRGWAGEGRMTLPARLGRWPAVTVFVIFALYQLAAIAPDDPRGLALAVTFYWTVTLIACFAFGTEAWLTRGEPFSIFFNALAGLLRRQPGTPWPVTTGVFYLTILASGSFDGLKDTFWWLSRIGINPLAFPGRSAVVVQTSLGLAAAVIVLTGLFLICAALGRRLARLDLPATTIFGQLALSVLPIALGYHVAHFLTALMVQGQYLMTALSDPLGLGWDLMGLGEHFVTTGFFYAERSVRAIWLTQAGAVVVAHVWAVILAHRLALRLTPSPGKAVRLLIPLSVLMVLYTVFGLWLLAAPRGV